MLKNIAIITYFNSKVGNLIIKKFFEKKIKIKDVILIGSKENKNVSNNYFNYTNSYDGIELINLEKYFINFHIVKKINSNYTENLLKKLNIHILLSNAGIIKKKILNIPNLKIINSHPGILPNYRGSMCPEWAILNNERMVGATCHFVTKDIDSGPIIYKKKLKFPYNKNYFLFRKKVYELQADVMVEGVRQILKNKKKNFTKQISDTFYKPMGTRLIKKVKKILRERLI